MNYNSWPYSKPGGERQFDINAKQKNAYNVAGKENVPMKESIQCKEKKNNIKREQDQDIEKEEEQSLEDKIAKLEQENKSQKKKIKKYEEEERKHQKRKKAVIMIVIFFALSVLATYGFEGFYNWMKQNNIKIKILEFLPFCVEVLPLLLKMPEELRKSRIRREQEGLGEGMWEWTKDFLKRFSKASGMQIWAIIIFVTLMSQRIAYYYPFEHLQIFFKGGCVALENVDIGNNEGTDALPTAGDILAETAVSSDIKIYLTKSTEIAAEQLDRAEVTNTQKDRDLKLSKEKNKSLFGLGKDKTQEQVNESVYSMVEECCEQKLENVFDKEVDQGGAPQHIRNQISQASEEESSRNNFADVEGRLELRESVVRDYPKRKLMQLVANDCQYMALLLVWHGGKQNTIIYYYGQSILYDFECLKFAQNTDTSIKIRLEIIAQRYEDIVYVCPDFEYAEEARRLAEAFRYVADQY